MSVSVNVADVFKIPVKKLLAVVTSFAIGTGLILFLPSGWAEKLHIDSFRESFGFIIGIVFITAISIISVTFLFVAIPHIYKQGRIHRELQKRRKQLNDLNDYQMYLVYSLYKELNHTGELPKIDGEVIRMEHGFILAKATQQYVVDNIQNPVWPYMLQPWVVDYLDSNPQLAEKYKRAFESIERKKQNEELEKEKWYSPF